MDKSIFRKIPKMDNLLKETVLLEAADSMPRGRMRSVLQKALEELRSSLLEGAEMPSESALLEQFANKLRIENQYHLRKVINATGIVLHTNLGRAPISESVAAHMAETISGYSNLEYNLEAGRRGSRMDAVIDLLREVTGAEDAVLVNNNASAVFLVLHTLTRGKRVAVSRGELVEIGGSFRVPEIMKESGADLIEIGTTNKTHLWDYERAVDESGAEVLLKVHSSNFKIIGFTEEATLGELSVLAREKEIPLLYDLGSGFLVPPERIGLPEEAYVQQAVKEADVVCFSGDKLLGAGQAGIILGKKKYIERIKKNQLLRMLRVNKTTLASMEAVLRFYTDPEVAIRELPVLSMLSASPSDLKARALKLKQEIDGLGLSLNCDLAECKDSPGGGSLPGTILKGYAVALSGNGVNLQELEHKLRQAKVPVISYIEDQRLMMSVRTVKDSEYVYILQALNAACKEVVE